MSFFVNDMFSLKLYNSFSLAAGVQIKKCLKLEHNAAQNRVKFEILSLKTKKNWKYFWICAILPPYWCLVCSVLYFFENVFLKPPNYHDHENKPTLSPSTMTFILHAWVFYQLLMIRTDDNTIETVVDVLSTHQPAPMRTKSTSSFGSGFPFAVFSSAIFLKWGWILPAVERFLIKTDKKCTAPSELTLTLQKGLPTARKYSRQGVFTMTCAGSRAWNTGASFDDWKQVDPIKDFGALLTRDEKVMF